MAEFNQKVLEYSNASDGHNLVASGKFHVYIQQAARPSLVPGK